MKGRLLAQVLSLSWVCHPVSSRTAECRKKTIDQYRRNNRPIISRYRLSVDYRCISRMRDIQPAGTSPNQRKIIHRSSSFITKSSRAATGIHLQQDTSIRFNIGHVRRLFLLCNEVSAAGAWCKPVSYILLNYETTLYHVQGIFTWPSESHGNRPTTPEWTDTVLKTRHRASTRMYSLTFRVRVMLP